MNGHSFRWLAFVLCAGLLVAIPGCSKKSVESDPTVMTEDMGDSNRDDGSTTENRGDDGSGADERDVVERSYEMQDVFFDFDRYQLRSDARFVLQENARYLQDHPGATVVLEGHCDERGTNEYNIALGQRRADTVKDYLVDLGISSGRLTTLSYGEERPFALASTEAAWAQNRRVHFNVRRN